MQNPQWDFKTCFKGNEKCKKILNFYSACQINALGYKAIVFIDLNDWFARKNVVDDTIIFFTLLITVPFQVQSITSESNPLQSGSVFYERAKLTGVIYKHGVIFAKDGCIVTYESLC